LGLFGFWHWGKSRISWFGDIIDNIRRNFKALEFWGRYREELSFCMHLTVNLTFHLFGVSLLNQPTVQIVHVHYHPVDSFHNLFLTLLLESVILSENIQ